MDMGITSEEVDSIATKVGKRDWVLSKWRVWMAWVMMLGALGLIQGPRRTQPLAGYIVSSNGLHTLVLHLSFLSLCVTPGWYPEIWSSSVNLAVIFCVSNKSTYITLRILV